MLLNIMLLYLLRRLRKLQGNLLRLILAAAFGGFIACFLVLQPSYTIFFRAIFTYLIAGGGMIILAFGYHGWKKFFQNLCWLIVITIGLGGIVLFLAEQYISSSSKALHTSMVIIMALFGTGTAAILYHKFARQIKKDTRTCKVSLFLENRKVTVMGYLDSGNLLKEPISGKPVAVLEEQVFLELFEGQERENMERCLAGGRAGWNMAGGYMGRMRLIPYKSIGKRKGLMNGFVADCMEVDGEETMFSMRPVIAVYSGTLSSDGSYQMILPTTF